MVIIIGMAFGSGWLVASSGVLRRRRKGGKAEKAYLILYTGRARVQSLEVVPVEAGLMGVNGVVYPEGLFEQVMPYSSVSPFMLAGRRVWHMAVDPVELANHEALERGRDTVALSHLFSGGGSMLGMLQTAALLVPLVVTLFFWMSFGSVSTQVAQIAAAVQEIKAETVPEVLK